MKIRALFFLAVLIVVGSCKPGTRPEAPGVSLTLAVASSMQFAMEDLLNEYQAVHPGVTLKATYGSSGNFFAQIQNQAPFDLFFAADMEYPRKLVEVGLVLNEEVSLYALGGLALWVPKASPIAVEKLGMEALKDPTVKKVAMANPKLAPYGVAAEAALISAGLYEQAAPKIVLGDNITQTAQFVESGAADIGVLALSHVVASKMSGAGRYWVVPAASHRAIEQGMVILKQAQDVAAARGFRDFVLSAAGGKVLERHGFKLPPVH
jgi:molybdate transport system substrate-binding protein